MTAPPSIPPSRLGRDAGPDAPSDTWRPDVPPARRVAHGHRAPAIAVAVLAVVGVWVTWRLFVVATTGRLVDGAAFEGALYGRNRLWQVAEPVLDVISVPFIAGVLLATMLLAVLRRRVVLAVQVAILMGGANLTTQVLKDGVLPRPDVGIDDMLRNTLPSGHTTAAASVAAALVLVVPRRLRPTAAVIGVLYTAATGISTLVGRWHRPSDAIAAVLVVLAWAGVATAIGARVPVRPDGGRPRQTAAVAGLLVLAAVTSGALAVLALQRCVAGLDAGPTADAGLTTKAGLLLAYGGGALGVVAVTCAAFGLLLLMLRAAEPRVPEAL